MKTIILMLGSLASHTLAASLPTPPALWSDVQLQCNQSQTDAIAQAVEGAKSLASEAMLSKNDTLWELIFAGSDGPAVHGVYQNISNFSGGDLAVDYAYAKPGPRKFVGYGCDQANQPSYCSGFYANAVAVMSQRSTNQTEAGLPVSDWLLVLCPTFFDLPDQPALPDPAKPDGPVLDRSSCMLRELAELQDVEHSSPFPFLDESMKPLNPDSALAEKDYLLHNAVDPRVVADPNGCETYACVTTLAALSKNQTLLPGGEQYQPSGISVADYAKDIGVMAQYNSGSYAVFALLAHAQSKGES